ncbi:succinate semialdehyde dehydrogenase [Oceaniovalibus guishaninsula JLT2003]|uniref:Succinate semialdehyde dehydrogenase n=1 Tax=Oceaniovalibus guishaninsula JLT2003 TaxID=1231392 RepID=K2GQK3_9RHOB|nr:NAD-dependent succinate-semialdehyde dehydrogenase [Oceaniovalibus guishaninsula]EKE44946.1 succinate semialdehyde dehydrogenase [Oceaniovalibus guishaninsula JLT2003]
MYPDLHLYIAGEWRRARTDMAVLNPATEEEIGRLPRAEIDDLDDALEAAEKGFRLWRRTSPRERADTILRAAAIMRERGEEIARAITLEHGKPLAQARAEVIRGAEFFEWDAGEAMRTYGRIIPAADGNKIAVHHQPAGVVAAFSPWNFPMSQPARKVAGALASGCSIILKAAEETPAGAIHIARAFEAAGLPPGVLNLVFGDPAEISSHLIPAEPVRLVAFTGSTAVGRHLTTLASENMTPVLMELGGHAPVIVCEDTDVEAAAIAGAVRKMRNAGQVCTSPTRFFVHESIFDRFADAFTERAAATVVGDGTQQGTEMGPLANERRVPMLTGLIEDAVSHGADLRTGGKRRGDRGYFLEPTVLANVPDAARIMQEEPFGPVAVLNPVPSLDAAIEAANAVPFGLAGYAFTNRADHIDRMIDEVEVGNLSINTLEASLPETPFGGVKSSGYGREGGTEGLERYMTVKNVWHSARIA